MARGKNFEARGLARAWLLAGVSAITLAGINGTRAQEAPATTSETPTTTQAPATTQQAAPVPVPPVSVVAPLEATPTPATGTVADGYRVDTVTDLGPFSNMSLQNTPYSVNVLSNQFIENTGGYMSIGNDILDKSPFFADIYNDQRGLLATLSTRGLPNQNELDFFLTDGLPGAGNASNIGAEAYDRIEVLSGADTGFFYGVNGNAGGVNFVLKRPTPQPYDSATLGYDDGGPYGNVDVGDTLANGKFGYRFVAAGNFGDSASVANQSTGRSLVYSAFDVRPIDNLLVQLDVLHTTYHLDNPPPIWTDHAPAGVNPFTFDVPNPNQPYASPWTYIDSQVTQAGIRPTWNATDWLTLRGDFRYAGQTYDNVNQGNFLTGPGTYESWVNYSGAYSYVNFSGYTYADVKFDTWLLKHKLTLGVEESQFNSYDETPTGFASTPFETGLNFSQQPQIPYVNLASQLSTPGHITGRTDLRSSSVGDQVDIGPYFTVLGGINYAQIQAISFNAKSVQSNNYNVAKFAPTAALEFKPMKDLTTYFAYGESLQKGEIVNDPLATNNGAILPPYPMKQYEVGAKATVNKTLYTLAVFDIQQANLYEVINSDGSHTYIESGLSTSKGVEFSATGEVFKGVRVLGGFQFSDSKVKDDQANPALNGKVPQDAVRELVKVTAEYDIPFVPGLTATGGAYYTGQGYYDAANTVSIPGHTTFDLGLRYNTKLYGHDWTFRAYAENVTDVAYWYVNSMAGLGRRVWLTAQVKW